MHKSHMISTWINSNLSKAPKVLILIHNTTLIWVPSKLYADIIIILAKANQCNVIIIAFKLQYTKFIYFQQQQIKDQ